MADGTPTPKAPATLLEAALWYADLGFKVLPLHEVVAGICTCGRDDCNGPGKHPRIDDWPEEASSDPIRITGWWSTWPSANLGILGGKASGIVVLDVDPRHRGDWTLKDLEDQHGALPATWTVRTGGGGWHYYFKSPTGVEIQSSADRVGRGLDIRAEGGQVAAPPSLHASGQRYAWAEGRGPGEVALADLPPWLAALAQKPSALGGKGQAPPLSEKIPEGARNSTLASVAGTMRRRGMSEESILAALLAENEGRCDPPLDVEEVRRIASSIAGYDPADPPRQEVTEEEITEAKATIDAMIERAKEDPGAPFEMASVKALYLLREAAPADYERARATLRELDVGLRRLEGEIEKVASESGEAAIGDTEAAILAQLTAEADLFHRPDGDGFATLPVGTHKETWAIRSRDMRRWLVRQYFNLVKKPPKAQSLTDALCLLEARAQFDGEEREVHVRVASEMQSILVDLVSPEWAAIEVNAEGWRIVEAPNVRFRRAKGMLRLPAPLAGGSLETLRPFVNIDSKDDDTWKLLVAFLTSALRPKGPYPVLLLHGEQGSAKSTTARVIRAVIDPNSSPLRSEPRESRDLMIAAANGWIVCFDNLSNLPTWLSDNLCRLATGGGYSARALYTDDEERLFDAQRPVIITGIEEVVTKPDLLERCLIAYLPAIPETKRRRESDFWSDFNAAHGSILGALLDAVSKAMRALPEVKLERLPRMADFGFWGVALERALGWEAGSFLKAYEKNRTSIDEIVLEASSLGPVILEFAAKHPAGWEGTATALLGALTMGVDDAKRKREPWTRSPKNLSNALRRLIPNLRGMRVDVAFDREKTRRLVILKHLPAVASPSSPASPASQEHELEGDAKGDAGGDAAELETGRASPRDPATSPIALLASPCVTGASPSNPQDPQDLGKGDAGDGESPPFESSLSERGSL